MLNGKVKPANDNVKFSAAKRRFVVAGKPVKSYALAA
jgi:hypothetical protein